MSETRILENVPSEHAKKHSWSHGKINEGRAWHVTDKERIHLNIVARGRHVNGTFICQRNIKVLQRMTECWKKFWRPKEAKIKRQIDMKGTAKVVLIHLLNNAEGCGQKKIVKGLCVCEDYEHSYDATVCEHLDAEACCRDRTVSR